MNCVILQPSYIPWRGYFDQIRRADLFIFYDDVQYDKRGWRNRNRIKTRQGGQWLTIPVHSRGAMVEKISINEIEIDWEQPWYQQHLKAIQYQYGKAPYFKTYFPWLEEIYSRRPELLADFTIPFTIEMAEKLGITQTRFARASQYQAVGAKTDRLVEILQKVQATHYISGPSAKDYIEDEKFTQAGISLEYMQYNYPEYLQLYPPYDPYISALDLLLMTGPQALTYMDR